MPEDDLKPTPAEQWQSPIKKGFVVTLPSGNSAYVRRLLDLKEMIEEGKIPNPLLKHMRSMFESGGAGFSLEMLDEESKQQAVDFVNDTCVRMMIEPKVEMPPEGAGMGWRPAPGSISIADLTWEDRLFLQQLSQGGTASVDQFRGLQEKLVGSVEDGGSVEVPTERPPRPQRTRGGSSRKR